MSTPEERAEVRDELNGLIATNMVMSFSMSVARDGGLAIDVAVAGCVAMMDFGLVLAERHPELAATLREAVRADDLDNACPVNIADAVDAVVEHMK